MQGPTQALNSGVVYGSRSLFLKWRKKLVKGEIWVRFPVPELPLFPHFFQTKDLVVQKIADMCSMQPKPLARVWCTAQAPFS
jgi:hypothetical protein